MTFIKSLKLTKLKTITTIIFGFFFYRFWYPIAGFCSAGEPYKGKFELFSRGCWHLEYQEVALDITKILSDYLTVLIPILIFYVVYSVVQYYKSK